ncbi:MAG: ABC transporter permease [Planctomycetes bacterium]|nr:ABC transporter permease [Planctomycetota bacterium]
MFPTRLVFKNLLKHKLRVLLTVASIAIAVFLLCALQSLVVALDAGVREAASNRLIVQSKVSLFVYMPESYKAQLERVSGVERIVRWNWFGGYYQDPSNFFAQFATDADALLDVYPEIQIVEGSAKDFIDDQRSCIIGAVTAEKYGFKVGDTVPIIATLFPRTDGAAWDFRVAALYRSLKKNVDENTLFFHSQYLDKSIELGEASGPSGVGVFVLRTAPGVDQTALMSEIDAMYENGPQVVQTTTEAEFQAQFVSMIGNVPFFVNSIGTGVMIAILLAALNTMLMSAREQTRDVGVLKALGFQDGSIFGLLMAQSLVMCGIGGGIGIAMAKMLEPGMAKFLGTMFPGYEVTSTTLMMAAGLTVGIGVLAGIAPALRARSMHVIEALRATA